MPSIALNRRSIGLAVGLIGFTAILLLPRPEGMEPTAQRTGAVAFLMASWWISEAAHIAVTALLPLVLFPMLGILPSRAVSAHYANHIIFLFLGGFIIAIAMEKWNLHRRIALNTIARIGSEPRSLMLGFMVAAALLSMWISNTATTMMMLPIAMAVVNQLAEMGEVAGGGSQAEMQALVKKNFGLALLLGIAYAASIGGIGTIVGSPTTVAFLGFASENFPDLPQIGFVPWSAVCIPIAAVFLPLTWVYLCRFGADLPLSAIKFRGSQSVIRCELRKLGPIAPVERLVLIVSAGTGLLWITRSPIDLEWFTVPGWSALLPGDSGIHDATVAMGMAVLLFLLPADLLGRGSADGLAMDWKTAAERMPWGIVFLIGGGFALAAGISESGLAAWIGSQLSVLKGTPTWLLVLFTCLLSTMLTEATSNVATVLMFSPIIAAMAAEVGVHPYLLLIPVAVMASFAFTLPVATPPNAIVFSSGWITIPKMFRAGIALDALGLAVAPLMVYLLGARLFGFD